ncbi:MAG: uridylate kinase [Anaerolineales bacterium]|nr:uridylate kinase [Anaerolineales bacterium]
MRVVLLKLGGSLITDKRLPETPRLEVIQQAAAAIAAALQADSTLAVVLGHGSGSFGHVYGRRYGTRNGVTTPEQWYGFAAVADAAARLNRIVVKALLDAGIAAWGIQPGAVVKSVDGEVRIGPTDAVILALLRGLTPVVYGDAVIDTYRGGTIASTEEIFDSMIMRLQPTRVVLAGEVDGIYTADPLLHPDVARIEVMTQAAFAEIGAGLGGSHGVDVTGGMRAKVEQALAMTRRNPGTEVVVCSGLDPNTLLAALSGADVGTVVRGG